MSLEKTSLFKFIMYFVYLYISLSRAGRLALNQQTMSRVNLSQITSLNFEADEYTTGRRLAPVAQLQCDKKEGRSACEQYTPESIHCENRGWDAYTHAVQWSCSTTLPSNLKLGKVRVNCERWEESGPANEVLNGE